MHCRPVFRLERGILTSEDEVTIIYGDRIGGSRGFKVQTYSNDAFPLPVYLDLNGPVCAASEIFIRFRCIRTGAEADRCMRYVALRRRLSRQQRSFLFPFAVKTSATTGPAARCPRTMFPLGETRYAPTSAGDASKTSLKTFTLMNRACTDFWLNPQTGRSEENAILSG